MSSAWFDETDNDAMGDEPESTFYCPYTNGERCALITKGWQPQELCLALECEQVKLVRHGRDMRRKNRAA